MLDPTLASLTSRTNGFTANFTNTSTAATSYAWDFGDGSNSTEASPTHTYSAGGNYTVTLTANGACGTNTATQSVTILSVPTAGFTSDITSGCGPITVQFNSQTSNDATSYAWIFYSGTPSFSTEPNPVVSFATPGLSPVQLIVSNASGSDTLYKPGYINVLYPPTAIIQVNYVFGPSVSLYNNSYAAITSSLWDFGDGATSTETEGAHIYEASGIYMIGKAHA